ncbi:MAG: VCBS repeat-containing protein [Limnoraphis sp. WC205]|nr:VCBS repeat-containing protein [Limnoraphis sp. WC205]
MPDLWFSESENNHQLNTGLSSENVLNLALTGVQSQLQVFLNSPDAFEQLDQVFDITDPKAADLLIKNGAAGNFENIPDLQILPDAAMNGAQGGFSNNKDTIYLAESLVQADILGIQETLIEEIGHKFDTLLNPGGDTPGDEGELFKDIVLGLPLSQPELLRIQTENDFGTVVVDNQVISVEQSYNSTDVTGDGKADAIVSNNDGVYVRRSNGSKFLPNEKWIDIPFWGSIGTGFADVTGDGKADAIASNNDGVYVRRSNGSKFLPNEKWTDIGYSGTQGTWFADVTGDGKADAIVSNNDGVYIRRSNGSKFLPNEKWTEIGYLGSKGTWFADVTGDGKADAIVANNDGVYIRRSDGNKFLPNEKWTDIGYWGSQGTWFADVTGDGKADAIASNNDGVYIRRSDGNKFLPNEKWTEIGYLGSKAAGFGDVTGDGKADAIVSNEDGVYVRRSNGSKFLPNEKWTDIGYWGSKGTWFGDVALTGTSLTPPVQPGNPDIDIQLIYPNGGFTNAQRAIFEQAAQNWENVITKDKVKSGVLKIAITQGSKNILGNNWKSDIAAETYSVTPEEPPNIRYDLTTNPNLDGHNQTHFNSAYINGFSKNNLIRLTMHEMGHALGLNEANQGYDTTLLDTAGDSLMDLRKPPQGQDMKITEGMNKKLEYFGYGVNRSPSINWW